MKPTADLAASVAARLLNRARQTGDDYQSLLTTYCLERFLYRLASSDRRDRFVLKGAMLLRLWSDRPYRATLDLDLLRRGAGGFDAIREDLEAIIETRVPPDAVDFAVDPIQLEAIRAEDEYSGTRATLEARRGKARLRLQIDMGLGDAVWPAPLPCAFPTLLDLPAPQVLAYPREAVIAEKLEAVVVLGDRNSRIKDFFDLHYLATRFEFDRVTLTEAVRRTFERRRTPVPATIPIGLTRDYWRNPSRPDQARAFARRSRIEVPAGFADDCARILHSLLWPIVESLQRGATVPGTWRPGGPWSSG